MHGTWDMLMTAYEQAIQSVVSDHIQISMHVDTSIEPDEIYCDASICTPKKIYPDGKQVLIKLVFGGSADTSFKEMVNMLDEFAKTVIICFEEIDVDALIDQVCEYMKNDNSHELGAVVDDLLDRIHGAMDSIDFWTSRKEQRERANFIIQTWKDYASDPCGLIIKQPGNRFLM